jgi:hypothetical protein
VILAAALVACACHPDSRSRSHVTVQGARVTLELQCQAQSVLEALPLDLDGDGELARYELERTRERIAGYIGERYRLYAEPPDGGGAALALELAGLELVRPPDATADWIAARLVGTHARELERLWIRVTLFLEQNPLHRDECTLVWNALPPARFRFGEQGALWAVDPGDLPGPRPLDGWVGEGLRHILGGPDHLAFLGTLLLAAGSLRALVWIVTAFTAAHSLSLALAALELVRAPPLFVELAIALSISYVAVLNLYAKQPVARWQEALGFGLVHGLGFAGFLGELLAAEPGRLKALFGFNLGVELGQLTAVVPVALLLSLARARQGEPAGAWLAPRWLRLGGSLALGAAGLYWFVSRAGFLGFQA